MVPNSNTVQLPVINTNPLSPSFFIANETETRLENTLKQTPFLVSGCCSSWLFKSTGMIPDTSERHLRVVTRQSPGIMSNPTPHSGGKTWCFNQESYSENSRCQITLKIRFIHWYTKQVLGKLHKCESNTRVSRVIVIAKSLTIGNHGREFKIVQNTKGETQKDSCQHLECLINQFLIRIKSMLTFQGKTDQHGKSYRLKVRGTFLYSWLNTTRLLIGSEMGKTKSKSVGRLTNAYQKQETNHRMYQIRHRHGDSQNARRGIKMINKRIKGQSQNLKIRIKQCHALLCNS